MVWPSGIPAYLRNELQLVTIGSFRVSQNGMKMLFKTQHKRTVTPSIMFEPSIHLSHI